MTLDARLVARRGRFRLDVGLTIERGETVALLGPSGAGKTTVVRLLAGVASIDDGHIRLDGTVVDDPATGAFVAPHRRRVGWVPQGGGLFPHLSAVHNVAFALRARGTRRATALASARDWLTRVHLADRSNDSVEHLSGGEGRRVAIARALASDPALLLFDEPFTGLDVAARVEVRQAVRDAWDASDAPRLLVAHEPVDALSMADRVIVIEEGAVVQVGTPGDLCERPRTAYVAELAGLNLVRGSGGTEAGHPVVRAGHGEVLQVAESVEGSVVATFRPSAVAVFREAPGGSPRNVLEGTVSEIVPTGERVRVRIDSHPVVVAELTTSAAAALELRPGDRVYAVVKATEIEVRPAP
ncbi:MAG TPA: ABC transporter ATP-binding protein [Acidimicrobiia bacterium]|nr:ABC transporter ATP-binding protein [Acidimicrobiia bacterium]